MLLNALVVVRHFLHARQTAAPGPPANAVRRASMFQQLPTPRAPIVFLGDSITAECEWSELLGWPGVVNRGIGSDTTATILARIAIAVPPDTRRVFLMAGINDLAHGFSVPQVVSSYTALLGAINRAAPNARIVIQSVLPVYPPLSEATLSNGSVAELNRQLRDLSSKNDCDFLDVASALSAPDGTLRKDLTNDGVHLMGEAYAMWGRLLESHFN
jgi:lysophospholipase L1-like esterase